jgi:hypothetical protein
MTSATDPKKTKVSTQDVLGEMAKMVGKYQSRLPVVQLAPLVPNPTTGDEEVMVVVVSDMQAGHLTPTTNARVLARRADRLTNSVIRIAGLHRHAYPVRKLVVCLNGDLVHHERVGINIDLDQLEVTLLKQMYEVVIPIISRMLLTWCTQFEEVEVYTASGNHGSFGKMHSGSLNADTLCYLAIRDRLQGQPNLTFHVTPDTFYQQFRIFKTRFMLTHGDSIRMWMNLPFYGIVQRALRWRGSLGEFDVLLLGHFHSFLQFQFNNWECMVNGCWVSNDQWCARVLGMSSSVNQTCFGVHPRGITWRYRLDLDR